MKITFLGTAAAVGLPHQFCNCTFCEKVRQLGGKNIRTRAGIAIDTAYHIDFPPDSFYQAFKFSLPLYEMKHLLITHSHPDHLDVGQLFLRKEKFRAGDIGPLHIYGPKDVRRKIMARGEKAVRDADIYVHTLKPYSWYDIGDMRVLPLTVLHDRRITCYNYIIEYEGKRLYIGYDVGTMPERTMKKISKYTLDFAVFEYTMGDSPEPHDHLNTERLFDILTRLKKEGALTKNTRIFLSHFSHYTAQTHSELVKRFRKYGIRIAYDGLVVEL